MSNTSGASQGSQNPWKLTTIGLVSVVAAVLIGGVVKASFDKSDEAAAVSTEEASATDAAKPAPVNQAASKPAPRPEPVRVASQPPPVPQSLPRPTSSDVAECNQYAASVRTETADVVRDGVVGGALGAAVGAATGAIAHGGKGAGKGAGIGAIVGATGGTVYGLNQKNQDDARAQQAYQSCMAQRGF